MKNTSGAWFRVVVVPELAVAGQSGGHALVAAVHGDQVDVDVDEEVARGRPLVDLDVLALVGEPRCTRLSGSSASCWVSSPWGAKASYRGHRGRGGARTRSSGGGGPARPPAPRRRPRLGGHVEDLLDHELADVRASIGGRGSDTSSKQMVRRIPGRRRAGSGWLSPRGGQRVADGRHGIPRAPPSAPGRRRRGCPRAAVPGCTPRRARRAWAGWIGPPPARSRVGGSSRVPFRPLSAGARVRVGSLGPQVERDFDRPPPAGGAGVGQRLLETLQRVGRRRPAGPVRVARPPPWPGRRCGTGARRAVRRSRAVRSVP